MQPFNKETLLTVLLGVAAIAATYFLFYNVDGWIGIIIRSVLFSGVISWRHVFIKAYSRCNAIG